MAKREPSAIRIEGDVAYVTLTQGFEAAVDLADLDAISAYRWRVQTLPKGHAYATRPGGPEEKSVVLMHRQLMQAADHQLVDHVDGDGLNNRRQNMRFATGSQNNANRVAGRRNALGFKGVEQKGGRFKASIKTKGKNVFLGSYGTPEEAAAAHYGAARVLWGDFATR